MAISSEVMVALWVKLMMKTQVLSIVGVTEEFVLQLRHLVCSFLLDSGTIAKSVYSKALLELCLVCNLLLKELNQKFRR